MKKLRRAGEVAKATGLTTAVLGRLADRGIIPSIRPDLEGNRYYDPDAVLMALGLAAPSQEDEQNHNTQEASR